MDIVERLRDGCECKFADADCLAENACRECMEAADEIERLREALHMWDALIQHKYNGSRQAMNDMTDAAQHTAQVLYGDPPWPDPKTALQQKESK